MKRNTWNKVLAVGAAATAFSLATAPAYAAAVSQASGNALTGKLLGTTLVGTPTVNAVNDGTVPLVTDSASSSISVLPGQSLANTGVLTAVARAANDGRSAACSGIVGSGGSLSVGEDGSCTHTAGTAPAVVNLGSALGIPISLRAEAIYGSCFGTADGVGSFARSTFVNAELRLGSTSVPINVDGLVGSLTGLLAPLAPLLVVSPNDADGVDYSTPNSGATPSARALRVAVLQAIGPSLTDIEIGRVNCGPNARLAEVPAVPAEGIWYALGGMAAASAVFGALYLRRRTVSAHADSTPANA